MKELHPIGNDGMRDKLEHLRAEVNACFHDFAKGVSWTIETGICSSRSVSNQSIIRFGIYCAAYDSQNPDGHSGFRIFPEFGVCVSCADGEGRRLRCLQRCREGSEAAEHSDVCR